MKNGYRIISIILVAVMLLMLLPALTKEADDTAEETTEEPAQRIEENDAQRLDTSYSLLLSAIEAEDYNTAKVYIEECLALCDPETNSAVYADLLLKKACIAVIEEQNEPALQALDAALEMQPELADAYLVRTQIYLSQGETEEAVRNLEKYIVLSEDVSLYETVAQLYESMGDYAAAETAYEKYIVGTGDSSEKAVFQTGIYKMEAGQLEEAVAALEACLDSESYGPDAAYNIGICKMSLEDYGGAREAFDVCMEKGGLFEGIYYNRGVCNLVSEDWEAAVADFEKSIEAEPYVDDARYNLGVCLMQMEDYESAVAVFTELIEANKQSETDEQRAIDDEAYYCRAMCNAMLDNLEEAILDYTACIEHEYELAQCYSQRAQVYAALGDMESYNSDLEMAQKYKESIQSSQEENT